MEDNTYQGLQNQMFGVFIVLIVLMQMVFQTLPAFVTQRTQYEARERQSKTYAWQVFLFSNIFVEVVWHMVSLADQPFFPLSIYFFLCSFPLTDTNAQYPTLSSCPSLPSCAGIFLLVAIGTLR